MDNTSILAYTGAFLDRVTGGYPLGNGYRTYLPPLMRFNAPDDFSPFGPGGVNCYAYCTGDPVNDADPTGHIPLFESFTSFLQGALGGRAAQTSSRGSNDELEEVTVIPRNAARQAPAEDTSGISISSRGGVSQHPQGSLNSAQSGVSRPASPLHQMQQLPPPLSPDGQSQAVAGLPIYELISHDSSTGKFHTRMMGQDKTGEPDGLFIYVNPAAEADKVYIMSYYHSSNQGHVSIARSLYGTEGQVHYAGEMKFSQGQMEYFNFSSGHYRPPSPYADYLDIAPAKLRMLLPKRHWKPREQPDNTLPPSLAPPPIGGPQWFRMDGVK